MIWYEFMFKLLHGAFSLICGMWLNDNWLVYNWKCLSWLDLQMLAVASKFRRYIVYSLTHSFAFWFNSSICMEIGDYVKPVLVEVVVVFPCYLADNSRSVVLYILFNLHIKYIIIIDWINGRVCQRGNRQKKNQVTPQWTCTENNSKMFTANKNRIISHYWQLNFLCGEIASRK